MDQRRKRKNSEIFADGSFNIRTNGNKFDIIWSIENFSQRSEDTGIKISSPTFINESNNKSEWCLEVYPNGKKRDSEDYVSVYLILRNPRKLRVKYSIYILNEKEEEKNIAAINEVKDFVKNNGFGKSKFVRKDFLLDETNGLLVNDMLKILCKIQEIKCELENHDNPDTPKGVRIPQSKLISDYGNMLVSPTLPDCIIKVGDIEIKVHKAVLAARSPVFYQIFNATSEKPQSNVIEMDDYRIEVVWEMLNYIYKEKISNIHIMAEEMFKIANKYELDRLEAISENYLCSTLAIDNVLERYVLSDKYSTGKLNECCQEFILKKMGYLAKTKDWKKYIHPNSSLLEKLLFKSCNISSIESSSEVE